MGKSATPNKPRRRANGEGSLFEDAAGRWHGSLTWTTADGARKRRTVYGPSQAEARRKLTKLRSDLDAGKEPESALTVAAFLAGWLERERSRIRPSTWRGRDQRVRTWIAPHLGSTSLAKLTPADVERLITAMIAAGRSPRTAVAVRVTLRRALGDAVRDGLVHRNVAALARPPRVPTEALTPGRDYFDPAQLRRLLDSIADHPTGPLVTVAAMTGLRQGELLGLTWPDVDLAAGTLTVRRSLARSHDGWELAEPKTARSRRTLNLPARAAEALRVQQKRQESARELAGNRWQDLDGLVFTDADIPRRTSDGPATGQALHGYTVTKTFHAMTTAAGLPSIPFHGLRHSAATALLAAGVPLIVVADLLGHSTIVITANTYSAVVPELRREAASAMDRALG